LQECLTNVHRHSGSPAARIRISLENGSLHLEISDSGRGMPPVVLESHGDVLGTMGVGLRGMNERVRQLGGTLSFTSNAGTTVSASLPLALENSSS
jgi:two-component system, NarL family, sensor kinase